MGRVVELDAAGQVRWEINGLRYPVDAQVVGPDRVLIADYMLRQVTERNFKGDILWQYDAPGMLISARRQRNGHMVVVTRDEVIDLDREGREAGRFRVGNGRIAAAQRLPNRNTAVVTSTGEFTLYDPTGQVLRNFNINSTLFPLGCSIDVLPNGNALLPLYTGQVVEVDMTGKVVWQAASPYPIGVQRLPNGNTLVTSRVSTTVSELDKDGKVVSEVSGGARIQHASRR
jgi:hypothetical protein